MSALNEPASNAATVTPSAVTVFDPPCRGVYVGGGGDVVVKTVNGQTVTFTAVPAGTVLPVRALQVLTASTATSMLRLW